MDASLNESTTNPLLDQNLMHSSNMHMLDGSKNSKMTERNDKTIEMAGKSDLDVINFEGL